MKLNSSEKIDKINQNLLCTGKKRLYCIEKRISQQSNNFTCAAC